jgi:hypothetical protein
MMLPVETTVPVSSIAGSAVGADVCAFADATSADVRTIAVATNCMRMEISPARRPFEDREIAALHEWIVQTRCQREGRNGGSAMVKAAA